MIRSNISCIYTIARNTALNYLKHKLVEENFRNSLNDFDVEEADSSDEILFAKEISLLVEMTVCRMPVQRRKIYQMSREKGISNNEIAEELGISKKTGKQIKNRISFCVNDCKILAIRFEKVSQNVLRFIRYDFLRNKIP